MNLLIKNSEVDVIDSTRIQITFHILDNSPIKVATLCKALQMPRQKVNYHLTQLVADGIIYKENGRYAVQPILENFELLVEKLNPLITFLTPLIYYGQAKSPEDAVMNVLATFFQRITIDIEEEDE